MAATARPPRIAPLLALLALAGCDTLFGPGDPAQIEITPGSHTFGFVLDTVRLEAVVKDDDGEVIPDAALTWSSGAPGVVGVDETGLVTALANGTTYVSAESGAATESVSIRVESPVPCAPLGDLAVPDTLDGSLSTGDCQIDDWFTDGWRLELSVAQDITIDITSDEFDTFLLLLDPSGQLVGWDDDSGGDLNSRLYIELGAGTYYPFVSSYSPGETGAYRLTTMEGAHPSPCPATDTVTFPDTVTDTVTTGSCDFNGFYIDVWRLDLTQTTVVTMQAVADTFEMSMAVVDTLGRFLAGGNGGPQGGAWFEGQLSAGSYDLWVGGSYPTRTGGYTFQVNRGPATRYCPTEGAIAVGSSVDGQLGTGDCWVLGSYADGWELTVADTTDVALAVTGDTIHAQIFIADSVGRVLSAYWGNGSVTRADTTLLPGLYRVWVRSPYGETGEYRFSVAEQGQLGNCEPVGAAVLDSTYEGALATTDCVLLDGRYTDVWTLQLDSATNTTIDLTSDKFDAFLMVSDTLGTSIAQDDDSGTGSNASLTLALDSGVYHLWATSYAAEALGGYEITAARETAAAAARSPVRGDGGRSPTKVAPRAPFGWPLTGQGPLGAWTAAPGVTVPKASLPWGAGEAAGPKTGPLPPWVRPGGR